MIKIEESVRERIVELREQGVTRVNIATRMGVGRTTVHRVLQEAERKEQHVATSSH